MPNINFLNITQEEFLSKSVIHKHMCLEYALSTLKQEYLWFANPVTWKDPFERRFIEASYRIKGSYQPFPWKNDLFCICMTQSTVSEAHWNTYSKGDIGIEFRIRRSALLDELDKLKEQFNIYIGAVEYMTTADIKKSLSAIPMKEPVPAPFTDEWYARLLLLKRNAFRYEDEIRIILVRKTKQKKESPGYKFEYRCGNTNLIQTILIGPEVTDNVTDLLKKTFIEDYGFTDVTSNGKTRHRVLKSQLYKQLQPQRLKF